GGVRALFRRWQSAVRGARRIRHLLYTHSIDLCLDGADREWLRPAAPFPRQHGFLSTTRLPAISESGESLLLALAGLPGAREHGRFHDYRRGEFRRSLPDAVCSPGELLGREGDHDAHGGKCVVPLRRCAAPDPRTG